MLVPSTKPMDTGVSFGKEGSIIHRVKSSNYALVADRSDLCESSITEFDVEMFDSIDNNHIK